MSNIQDTATLNEIRRLKSRIVRLESDLSRTVKNTTSLLNHSELNQLDYASSGHTGFASDADLTTLEGTVTTHVADTSNPHTVTWQQAVTAGASIAASPLTIKNSSITIKNILDTTVASMAGNTGRWSSVTDGPAVHLNDTGITWSGDHTWSGSHVHNGSMNLTGATLSLASEQLDEDWVQSSSTNGHVLTTSGGKSVWTAPSAEVNDLTAAVTWANVPDANITESSVTQHVAAIDHDSLLNFVANEHIDWTANAAGTIDHSNLNSTWPDNDKLFLGTGSDMELYHDATDNYIASAIAEGTADQAGLWSLWDIDTDQTSISAGAANRPYAGAQPIHAFGWTDAASARQTAWGVFPYQRSKGTQGPGIVTPLDNWFVGSYESSVYSGMEKDGSELKFYLDDVISLTADSTGIIVDGDIATQSGNSLALKPLAPTVTWCYIDQGGNMGGSSTSETAFQVRHRKTGADLILFNVWPGGTYGTPTFGVAADYELCFDATSAGGFGMTRGDSVIYYESAGSDLVTKVDGTEVFRLGAAVPNTYTLNATQVPSTTLLANASATAANNNAVLSQLIQDLQTLSLIG